MIKIIRIENTDTYTLGIILINGIIRFFSMELPWKNNENNISCIPCGTYPIAQYFSPHREEKCFLISNVPNRSGIEIHNGNIAANINGCIAVGSNFGFIGKDRAVLNSRNTLKILLTEIIQPTMVEIVSL
jgi:hypothetical protein